MQPSMYCSKKRAIHAHVFVALSSAQGTGHHTSAATHHDANQIHLPNCQTVLVAGVGLGTASGEADNPGPVGVSIPEDQSDLCHLTIVNITKLRKRQDEVLKLYSSKPGIVCCAETSSDTTMHCLFQKQARQRNLQYHPAPCAPSKIASQNTNVPYIGGVGMLCPHSSRMCPVIRSKAEWDSTRYTEAIVNFAGLQILGITLYLHTQDTSWELYRKDASDALQQRAIESVLEWDGHSFIAGDLNQLPDQSLLWTALSDRGWVETPTDFTYKDPQ